MITQAWYVTPEHDDFILVDDGREVTTGYPLNSEYALKMDEFIDNGGVIEPYDQYFGLTLDEVKEIGYSAVDTEEAVRVFAAQHNPATGVNLSDTGAVRANNKRNNKAKKKNNGISDADDHLLDHIDLLDDFGETLRDQIEACGSNACVHAVIGSVPSAAWPAWTPIA